jgi:hypothetical protein
VQGPMGNLHLRGHSLLPGNMGGERGLFLQHTTPGVAPVQILTPEQQRATQPVTPPSAPQPEQHAPNTASPPATSRSVVSNDAFEFGPSLAGTPRKVAHRLNRELSSLTSGWESTRPDLSLDRKSRRTRYSRDDDADAAPVSPRSQHLADQVMEGVVSDNNFDDNVLVCAVTADSFYPACTTHPALTTTI